MIVKIRENKYLIFIAILALMGVVLPLLQENVIGGSDDTFHLIRIETLACALKRGEFPVKVHSELAYGFGYGVGLFYSNCFLYIPAALMCLGLSLEVSYKLFEVMLFTATFFSMLVVVYRVAKNKYIALMAGILYIYSMVVLYNHYGVFSMGRTQAFVFMPLAIGGLYQLIKENKGSGLLIVGFSGLIYSHVLSTVVAVFAGVFIAIIYIKEWITDTKKWKSLLFSIISVVMITAAYWMPFVEQILSQKFKYSIPWTTVDENVVRLYNLVREDGVGFGLVIIAIIMGGWMLEKKVSIDVCRLYLSAVVFMLLPSAPIFWTVFRKVFSYLQFPDRLLIIAVVLLIMAFSLWIKEFNLNHSQQKIVLMILLVLSMFFAKEYLDKRISFLFDYGGRVLHEEIAGLGAGEEYLPLNTTREMLINPSIVYDNNGNQIEGERIEGKFIFDMAGEALYYDLPLIYYKGYVATDLDRKTHYDLSQIEETGMIRINVNAFNTNESTQVMVWYEGTMVQKIAYLVTAIGSMLYIILGGIKVVRKQRKVVRGVQ